MEHSVGRRAETPSGWRARRGFRKAEANEEQLARFKAAFDEADTEHTNTISISRLGAVFHKLGFNDVKGEEIEKLAREHAASAVQTDLEFQEFSSMMATFEEKRKFFSTVRLSREEWVLASLRSMSQYFRKESLSNGEVVWSRAQGDVTGQIILIMKGACTLLGTMGKVELPICGVGPGTLIGNGYLPALASRVVAAGEVDVLACRPEDLRQRMGDHFIQELGANQAAQERLSAQRVRAFKDLFLKASRSPGIRLPFAVTKRVGKGAAAMARQDPSSFSPLPSSPLPRSLRPLTSPSSMAVRSPPRASLSLDDFVASPPLNRHRPRRPLQEGGKEGRGGGGGRRQEQEEQQRTPAHLRTYKPFNHRSPQPNIPRMVPKADYHVRIDTNTMLYDDLM